MSKVNALETANATGAATTSGVGVSTVANGTSNTGNDGKILPESQVAQGAVATTHAMTVGGFTKFGAKSWGVGACEHL